MIVGLLLAAGGARRFGSQKLVAALDGMALVRHAADALAGVTDALVVVVGSDATAVTGALEGIDAQIVSNAEWERGLSSSIRSGVAALPANANAVLIALGDEPRVSNDVSRAVVAAWRATGRPIVVARYTGETGHPVLFERSVFPELAALEGDAGAKRIITQSMDRVTYVDVNDAPPLDVDEPADLQRLESAIKDRNASSPNRGV